MKFSSPHGIQILLVISNSCYLLLNNNPSSLLNHSNVARTRMTRQISYFPSLIIYLIFHQHSLFLLSQIVLNYLYHITLVHLINTSFLHSKSKLKTLPFLSYQPSSCSFVKSFSPNIC